MRSFARARDGRIAVQVGETAMMIKPDGTAETLGIGPDTCCTRPEFEPVRDRLLVQRCDRGLLLVDGKQAVNLPTDGYHVTRLAVSPDGSRIAAAMGDRTVRLWDASGKLLTVFRGHSDLVMDVAFSPDGTQLASASYDKTVRVWDIATGRYRVLRGHTRAIGRVFWRSRVELVTSSWDGTLRVWPVPARVRRARNRSRAGSRTRRPRRSTRTTARRASSGAPTRQARSGCSHWLRVSA